MKAPAAFKKAIEKLIYIISAQTKTTNIIAIINDVH